MKKMKEQLEQYDIDDLFALKFYVNKLIDKKQVKERNKALQEIVEVLEKNARTLYDVDIIFNNEDSFNIDCIIEGFKTAIIED